MPRIMSGMRVWAAAIAVVALISFASWTHREGQALAGVRGFLLRVTAPISGLVHGAVVRTDALVQGIMELGRLRQENARLRAQLQEQQGRLGYEEELRQENQELRQLLQFKQTLFVPGADKALAASVVGRSPDGWFNQIVINRGSSEGVVRGMIAVTAKGIVGQVTTVQPHDAVVLLITSPDSGVGAMVQRETSRATGVAFGQAGDPSHLKLRFFTRNEDVLPGDVIVTSGLGQLFPKGLLIGYVDRVEDQGQSLEQTALVRPAVDLARVETVLLLPSANGGEGGTSTP